LGATVELRDPPALQACADASGVLWVSFCALLMRRHPGVRALFDPSLQALSSIGEAVSATDLANALVTRGETGAAVDAFFGNHDVLLTPVMPMLAPRLDQVADLSDLRPLLTSWCNLTGNPAASIPCGLSSTGLPIGLQVIGARNRDDVVLKACLAYERASQ
jgi:aspartyl-tRNA(Asn)/glutamyl-tRNA(Gln) amidotransferase subunit A